MNIYFKRNPNCCRSRWCCGGSQGQEKGHTGWQIGALGLCPISALTTCVTVDKSLLYTGPGSPVKNEWVFCRELGKPSLCRLW